MNLISMRVRPISWTIQIPIKEIIVDTWDVQYVEDPFYLFENLHLLTADKKAPDILETVSWVITDKNGNVEENSGFNGFNGGS